MRGTAIKVSQGRKNPARIYIQLRNRAVYCYGKLVNPKRFEEAKVRLQNKSVPLKGWIKVR